MGPAAGGGMSGWLMLAMPVLMIVTAIKALAGAARKPSGKTGQIAFALVVLGALAGALVLWSENIVLTLPGGADRVFGGKLAPYLLGDLVIHVALWTAIAWGVIRFARRKGAGE